VSVNPLVAYDIHKRKGQVYSFLTLKTIPKCEWYSRFNPEGVAEASQIVLRDVLPKLYSYE
jgi:hypothetical protein